MAVETSILMFIRTLHGGGAEKVFLQLAGGLQATGARVVLVAVSAPEPERAWVPEGVEVIDLSARSIGRSLVPLVRTLRAVRPSAVLSAVSAVNVVALLAVRLSRVACPVIVTEHNTQSVQRADARRFMRRHGTPRLMRWLYPRAARVIAVSSGVRADLIDYLGLDEDHVVAIPNPVLTQELTRLAARRIDEAWSNCIGDSPLVVSAGRLVAHKDHGTLLRAFALVRERRPDALLAILGDGECRAAVEDLVRDLGLGDAVLMTGFEENPYAWLSRAQVLALSSRYEGLPTILIEGLACGAAIVATDCPSGPREILEGGRLGHLVEPGDVEAFAQALLEALARGRPEVPDESLQRYRPESVVREYLDVIEDALTRRL